MSLEGVSSSIISVVRNTKIMTVLGTIKLNPISSVNFSLKRDSITASIKNTVGITIWMHTSFMAGEFSPSLNFQRARKINMSEVDASKTRTPKDVFFVSFRKYLTNSLCIVLLFILELHFETLASIGSKFWLLPNLPDVVADETVYGCTIIIDLSLCEYNINETFFFEEASFSSLVIGLLNFSW